MSALADRRAFGLNFERHVPEAVELPGRKVRKGDKVRILRPRTEAGKKGDETLWRVVHIDRGVASASLEMLTVPVPSTDHDIADGGTSIERRAVALDDLVVVAEFRDPIYPGLISTGKIERGGSKPFHAVINAENFHALETLLFTHRSTVDLIYIDPPYNTRDNDWKYNNDYVNSDDMYRHSKWLAFMERRLFLARQLLNPEDSVLIVTIDEKEYLRLGLLIEQVFPDARIQMISSVVNPKGVSRGKGFRRTDEYLFFVMMGDSSPTRLQLGPEWSSSATVGEIQDDDSGALETPDWTSMMRRGSNSARADRPSMFYPIYVNPTVPRIVEVGEPLAEGEHKAPKRSGLVAVLPLRSNGEEGRWQVSSGELLTRIEQGRVRLGRPTKYGYVVNYLPDGAYAAVLSERFEITGRAADGSLVALGKSDSRRIAPTQWKVSAHNASEYGSTLLSSLVPKRQFPFPKSLYAVEDALRFFVANKVKATIMDFFAGSGTTAHAVMRLNKQDGGHRVSISVTNNEVSADEQDTLRGQGLRPGDPEWEKWGICEYITKARVHAAITGKTHTGEACIGNYKFIDEFPLSEGFEENAEFFTLTYESPLRVSSNREFSAIASLLWLRAGLRGRRIDNVSAGWDVADVYGVLVNLDRTDDFLAAVATNSAVTTAFIVTDEERLFESVAQNLPDRVEPVRLYEAYLRNFEIESGRGSL